MEGEKEGWLGSLSQSLWTGLFWLWKSAPTSIVPWSPRGMGEHSLKSVPWLGSPLEHYRVLGSSAWIQAEQQ